MTTINIPASIEDATNRLGAVERLLVARNWERAAIVAAFVQPSTQGVGLGNTTSRVSPATFAALGIAGLRTQDTVRLYAQRWLDAHDNIPPQPGAEVELPEDDWPPSRTGTNGHSSEQGMADTIAEMTERHGAEAVAEAISETVPDVAARVRRPRTMVDDLRDDANEFADELDRSGRREATGATSRAAQEVILAAQRIAGARLTADLDQDRGTELISAVNHLRSFLDSWHGFLTGECATWSDNDRAFAAELGIMLEVHS